MRGIIYDVYVSDVVAKNREKVKNKTQIVSSQHNNQQYVLFESLKEMVIQIVKLSWSDNLLLVCASRSNSV